MRFGQGCILRCRPGQPASKHISSRVSHGSRAGHGANDVDQGHPLDAQSQIPPVFSYWPSLWQPARGTKFKTDRRLNRRMSRTTAADRRKRSILSNVGGTTGANLEAMGCRALAEGAGRHRTANGARRESSCAHCRALCTVLIDRCGSDRQELNCTSS
jgi:hypothetical protein